MIDNINILRQRKLYKLYKRLNKYPFGEVFSLKYWKAKDYYDNEMTLTIRDLIYAGESIEDVAKKMNTNSSEILKSVKGNRYLVTALLQNTLNKHPELC